MVGMERGRPRRPTNLHIRSFCEFNWSSFGLVVLCSVIGLGKSDSRCFLENGGSSISFFVSEDAPVGYNIGTLEIQGDVRRDIVLSLKESTAPVRIESGTKNITLTRKLDKEGVEGPSTVTFTVLCDKRHQNEPSISTPVKIQVSDVNDSKPKWIGGPFTLNISEQTLPGSTVMTGLKATDMDQPGPHSTLTFSALDSHGKSSNYVTFAGGGLEGRLILMRPLDYEAMPEFDLILRVKDQGIPPLHSDTTLRVTVIDADDQNPRFQHVSYFSLLPTHPRAGMLLTIEPEPIRAMDQDRGIKAPLRFSLPEGRPETQYFRLDETSGRITVTRDIPEDQLNQPVTLVLKAEQLDNPDRYAISTLNIGKQGNRNAPLHFVQPEFQISIPENSPPGTILFTALTSRPADRNLRFLLEGDQQGLFQVGAMGQLMLKKSLDYEQHQKHIIKIWANDGYQNTSMQVIVNVLNVNDWGPLFRLPLYEFNITADRMMQGMPVGQIEVADGDLGDHLTLEIRNTDLIHVDGNGRLFLRNRTLVKREMMFLVVAKDTGDPPREAFVPVVVRLTDFPTEEEEEVFLFGDLNTTKVAVVSSLILVALALAAGVVIYFGYCRKRRKIQTEDFQKRMFNRNMTNPLAIHKLVQPGSMRRSNKVRNMSMNITSPIVTSSTLGHCGESDNWRTHASGNDLTPLDRDRELNYGSHANGTATATIARAKSVTWSPKVFQKVTPTATPTLRPGSTLRVNPLNPNSALSNGFELDPDTSVTPVETYNHTLQGGSKEGKMVATADGGSSSSLTLYF